MPRFVHSALVEVAVWAVDGFGEFAAAEELAVFAAIQQAQSRVDGESSFEAAAAEALDGLFAEDIDKLDAESQWELVHRDDFGSVGGDSDLAECNGPVRADRPPAEEPLDAELPVDHGKQLPDWAEWRLGHLNEQLFAEFVCFECLAGEWPAAVGFAAVEPQSAAEGVAVVVVLVGEELKHRSFDQY